MPSRASVFEILYHCAQALDSGLAGLHVPYSYGFAIILLTVLVKALTFPLSKKQVTTAHPHPESGDIVYGVIAVSHLVYLSRCPSCQHGRLQIETHLIILF